MKKNLTILIGILLIILLSSCSTKTSSNNPKPDRELYYVINSNAATFHKELILNNQEIIETIDQSEYKILGNFVLNPINSFFSEQIKKWKITTVAGKVITEENGNTITITTPFWLLTETKDGELKKYSGQTVLIYQKDDPTEPISSEIKVIGELTTKTQIVRSLITWGKLIGLFTLMIVIILSILSGGDDIDIYGCVVSNPCFTFIILPLLCIIFAGIITFDAFGKVFPTILGILSSIVLLFLFAIGINEAKDY